MAKQLFRVSVDLTVPGTWTTITDEFVVKAGSKQEAKERAKAKFMKMIMSKKNWKAKVTETAPVG